MVNPEIIQAVLRVITGGQDLNTEPEWASVSGGSINHCYRVSLDSKTVFVKLNRADRHPGMFEAEAAGLSLLRDHSRFQIPAVLKSGTEGETAYLVMEFLERGQPQTDFWETFAQNLGEMHRYSNVNFGLDHDNYIGSLHQKNDPIDNWEDFYVEMRLEPQLRKAADLGLADTALRKRFDRLFHKMDGLFPQEPPALIHGDLWSGNFMCISSGQATIYDPAVYFGHREMDIAMSKLFGGFNVAFYDHYHAAYPLEQGWTERIALGQLYPLLVHVNLFGSGYLAQLNSCLRPFV